MTLDQITVNMDIIIRDEISEILSTKPEDQRYLNYLDMRQVCSKEVLLRFNWRNTSRSGNGLLFCRSCIGAG